MRKGSIDDGPSGEDRAGEEEPIGLLDRINGELNLIAEVIGLIKLASLNREYRGEISLAHITEETLLRLSEVKKLCARLFELSMKEDRGRKG